MLRNSSLTLILLVCCCAKSLEPIPDVSNLSNWISVGPPTADERACAHTSSSSWSFDVDGAEIRATRFAVSRDERDERDELPPFGATRVDMRGGRHTSLRTEDGWIVGRDAGEFGGGLWWLDATGDRSTPLGDVNVQRLYREQSVIFVVGGLHHKQWTRGDVLLLTKTAKGDSPWMLSTQAKLPSNPTASVVDDNGDLLVAVEEGDVFRFAPDGQLTKLMASAFPDTHIEFPPRSLMVRGDTLFIGYDHYVAKLPRDLDLSAVRWLGPPNCARRLWLKDACVCSAD